MANCCSNVPLRLVLQTLKCVGIFQSSPQSLHLFPKKFKEAAQCSSPELDQNRCFLNMCSVCTMFNNGSSGGHSIVHIDKLDNAPHRHTTMPWQPLFQIRTYQSPTMLSLNLRYVVHLVYTFSVHFSSFFSLSYFKGDKTLPQPKAVCGQSLKGVVIFRK